MNPDEGVDDIKLIPLIKNDELTGLSIQFEFFSNSISPPQKYLSESHLNCLGLAFFLSSVKAFNKENKFFVLDDVVSSYDANHRNRFMSLLLEKFSDYQIIVFTHEKNWFTHFSDTVKGRDWHVITINWSESEGSYIEESLQTLKENIELKIRQNEEDGLGNQIRKYMEFILKKIACDLEVKVRFLYNENNEHRMANELLCALKSTLKKSNTELAANNVFNRLASSSYIGNTESHDHRYRLSMGDIRAFWQDVLELENIVFCENCQKFVSMKYYDTVNKTVRCACTNNGKSYKWKK